MEDVCIPSSQNTILTVNVLFHSLILFTFLSTFYMLYASKIQQKAVNKQFSKLIKTNLTKSLRESGGELRVAMKGLKPALDILKRRYDEPDEATETYNEWLFRSASMLSAFLLITVFVVLGILRYSCGQCPSEFIWDVIKENAIIFAGVGAVEYMFFKNVALKYIPAPPSLMVDEILKKIKNGLF